MNLPTDEWYHEDAPRVSIVVPTLSDSHLTAKCLESIRHCTTGYKYEIIVVDNGSRPAEAIQLTKLPIQFRLIRLASNEYFGDGRNIGAEAAKGEFVVFLDSDTFVMRDWLTPLIDLLALDDSAGAVGPRFLFPGGQLQECGAFIDEAGKAHQVGILPTYHPAEEFEARIVDYCSAACLAIRTSLFRALHGFDPFFDKAYYEGVDICLRIAATGQFVHYCPRSTVVHVGSTTSSLVWSAVEFQHVLDANRRRFLWRWGSWLRARAEGRGPLCAPYAASGRQKVADC